MREYTVLLDPPTYAPPAVQQTPSVEAPRRATPSDSARIERQHGTDATPGTRDAAEQPRVTPPPAPAGEKEPDGYRPPPLPGESSYSRTPAGDYQVQRGTPCGA